MGAERVNIPLLRKVVEWAEAEAAKPEIDRRWEQSSWLVEPYDRALGLLDDIQAPDGLVRQVANHCGTAYCIAGYVAQMLDERYATEFYVDGVHLSDFAAEALGLSPEQGSNESGGLFSGFNTIEDVRRIAESLAGERL